MRRVMSDFFIFLLLSSLVVGQGQNGTVANGSVSLEHATQSVGWRPGPSTRGTTDVLWTCASTIFACSWTILHLNIPGCGDTKWKLGMRKKKWKTITIPFPEVVISKVVLRKAKWMIATILFPEFIFSKAVCELQMAVDDLHDMTKKGPELQWTVAYRTTASILYKIFHYFERTVCNPLEGAQCELCHPPLEESQNESRTEENNDRAVAIDPTPHMYDADLHGKRVWTLTHSYFANMGGLLRHDGQSWKPVTAHALINCCIGKDHDPLPYMFVSKKDIEDKSKADWVIKSLTMWQIFWLVVTVITRAARGMPIAQLEICTVAFAVLAMGTFAANLPKPKDVIRPIRFRPRVEIFQCKAEAYWGSSFFHGLYNPSVHSNQSQPENRIVNDFVRLEQRIPPMFVALAVSTFVFGGLHCLAWEFGFPTKAEMIIWMISSALSATIPLLGLLVKILLSRLIANGVRRSSGSFKAEWDRVYKSKSCPISDPTLPIVPGASPVPRNIFQIKGWSELRRALDAFVCHGINHKDFFNKFEGFQKTLKHQVDDPEHSQDIAWPNQDKKDVYLARLLCSRKRFVKKQKKTLEKLIKGYDLVSRMIMTITFLLYVSIRLILLILAIVALRKAPEGIYTTTWTKNLPSIS